MKTQNKEGQIPKSEELRLHSMIAEKFKKKYLEELPELEKQINALGAVLKYHKSKAIKATEDIDSVTDTSEVNEGVDREIRKKEPIVRDRDNFLLYATIFSSQKIALKFAESMLNEVVAELDDMTEDQKKEESEHSFLSEPINEEAISSKTKQAELAGEHYKTLQTLESYGFLYVVLAVEIMDQLEMTEKRLLKESIAVDQEHPTTEVQVPTGVQYSQRAAELEPKEEQVGEIFTSIEDLCVSVESALDCAKAIGDIEAEEATKNALELAKKSYSPDLIGTYRALNELAALSGVKDKPALGEQMASSTNSILTAMYAAKETAEMLERSLSVLTEAANISVTKALGESKNRESSDLEVLYKKMESVLGDTKKRIESVIAAKDALEFVEDDIATSDYNLYIKKEVETALEYIKRLIADDMMLSKNGEEIKKTVDEIESFIRFTYMNFSSVYRFNQDYDEFLTELLQTQSMDNESDLESLKQPVLDSSEGKLISSPIQDALLENINSVLAVAQDSRETSKQEGASQASIDTANADAKLYTLKEKTYSSNAHNAVPVKEISSVSKPMLDALVKNIQRLKNAIKKHQENNGYDHRLGSLSQVLADNDDEVVAAAEKELKSLMTIYKGSKVKTTPDMETNPDLSRLTNSSVSLDCQGLQTSAVTHSLGKPEPQSSQKNNKEPGPSKKPSI